jgi:hypothetical protein
MGRDLRNQCLLGYYSPVSAASLELVRVQALLTNADQHSTTSTGVSCPVKSRPGNTRQRAAVTLTLADARRCCEEARARKKYWVLALALQRIMLLLGIRGLR